MLNQFVKKQSVQDFYNRTSMDVGFYDGKEEFLLNTLSSLIKGKSIEDLKVLDLGCYDGRHADTVFSVYGKKIDGADISEVNIKKANSLNKTFIIDLDVSKLWEIEGVYDLIFAGDIIEHLVNTDWFMININKLLNMGGIFAVTTPNVASLGRRLLLLMGRNPYLEVSNVYEINRFSAEPVGHLRYFTKETLLALLDYYGFKVLKVETPTINLLRQVHINKRLASFFPSLGSHLFIEAKKVRDVKD